MAEHPEQQATTASTILTLLQQLYVVDKVHPKDMILVSKEHVEFRVPQKLAMRASTYFIGALQEGWSEQSESLSVLFLVISLASMQ